jgi:hypothetical protein
MRLVAFSISRHRLWLVAAVGVTSFGLVGSAVAAPRGPAARRSTVTKEEAQTRALAKKHFLRAKVALAQRLYDVAIVEMQKAYALWQHPVTLFNLALAHAAKGDVIEARRNLRRYQEATGRKEEKLPALLREAMEKTGVLIVQVRDPEGIVFIDGVQVGRERVEVIVKQGRRVVEIRVGDRVARRRVIDVEGNDEKTWEVEKLVMPAPEPLPTPSEPVGPKGLARLQRYHLAYFVSLAAVTTASLAGAAGVSGECLRLHREFARRPYDAELAERGQTMQTAANVLWGLAAVTAVATGAMAFFTRWRRRPASERAQVLPVVVPGGAAVTVWY